jgi:hypothetical protein
MKKTTYIKTAILSLMGGLVLLSSSCLKDSHYVNYLADAPLAEFPLAEVNDYQPGGSDGAYQQVVLDASSNAATYTLTVAVKVAAPKALTSSTTFTISTTDLTELNALNTANGTTMAALPAADFTIVGGNQVVVKGGTTTTYFNIQVNAAYIRANSADGQFALPLTITNAGGVQIALPEKYLVYNFFAE